jgi:hypothetical protein
MTKITIASGAVRELSGKSATTGKPYELRVQTGYLHTMSKDGELSPFPDKFDFFLDREQQPYPPGEYTLHPSAPYVDRNGRLAVAPRLAPMTKAAAPANR